MGSTFDIGDLRRVASTFTDTGGSAADPTNVKLHIETTSTGVQTFTRTGATTGTVDSVVRVSAGTYYYDWTVTTSGIHEWRWTSTGSGADSQESWFNVRRRRVTT